MEYIKDKAEKFLETLSNTGIKRVENERKTVYTMYNIVASFVCLPSS